MTADRIIPFERRRQVWCWTCRLKLADRDGAGRLFAPCGLCGHKTVHVTPPRLEKAA